MPFCQNKDVSIYYEEEGKGKALIFISGLSGGSWSWFKQMSFFKNYYRVILFDNRGAGKSSYPPGPYTMKEMAEDVLSLMNHLKIDKAFIVGISMGGMIAQQLGVMAPERIYGMVLGCTHCGKSKRIPPSKEVLKILTNNEGLTPEEIVEKNIPLLFGKKCIENHPEIIEEYKKNTLSAPIQPFDAFMAQLSAINSFDVCHLLHRITFPTLIITGKDDSLVPPENSKILAKLIPSSTLIELDNVGHAIHLEKADLFNEKVLDFLKSCPT